MDSGIRSPTELVNIRVADFSDNFSKVQIREEASKTFGRRINLMLCSAIIKEYVAAKGLSGQDAVFPIHPAVANRYLKRLATRVLGNGTSLGGERYSKPDAVRFPAHRRMLLAAQIQVRVRVEVSIRLEEDRANSLLHRTSGHEGQHLRG